jgi:hypothetical protein
MSATPVTLQNATDATVFQQRPSTNYADAPGLRLRAGSGAEARSLIYFARPFPLGATILDATLRLYATAAWPAQSRRINAYRCTQRWVAPTVTWNNQPPHTTSAGASLTKTTAVAADEVWAIDVTDHMQLVADGTAWFGWKLTTDDTTLRYLHSTQGEIKPTLTVTYAMVPTKPSTLSPAGGRATSLAAPPLRFDFTDQVASSSIQAAQVRIGTDATLTTGVWDSGVVYVDAPQVDLAGLILPRVANGGFDTDLSGWVGGTNTTLARTTNTALTNGGSAGAAQLTAVAAGDMHLQTNVYYDVVPGQSYALLGSVRTAATGRTVEAIIDWRDAGGTIISSTVGTGSTDTTSYAGRTVTGVAPVGADTARLRFRVAGAAAAEVHYVDSVNFKSGNQTTFNGVPTGTTYYWQARVQDQAGLWSPYSDIVAFSRQTKATTTITNPPATGLITEATPPIAWTFTGQQRAFQVIITDAAGNTDANSGVQASTATSWAVPAKVLHDGETYTATVRVWDQHDREKVPGDTPWAADSQTFTLSQSATVAAVTAFTSTDLSPQPAAQLDWTSATMPDSYTIVRDGRTIEAELEPSLLLVSGTAYRYVDWGASPRRSHTWIVRRVVNGVTSSGNPSAVRTLNPQGVWLIDDANDVQVQILGQDPGSWEMPEQAANFDVLGATRTIRITQGLQGFQGEISGTLAAYGGQTLAQIEADFYAIKGRPGRPVRLVVADLNLPVIVWGLVSAPTPAPDLNRAVKFNFAQTGGLPFKVTL